MALNLPAYSKTSWAAEMPITADRMNKLENAVQANRNALLSHDEAVDSIDTRISDRVSLVTTGIAANAQLGAEAKAEIAEATTGNTPVYNSLDARFQALEDALGYIQVNGKTTPAYTQDKSVSYTITLIQNSMSNVSTEVQNARTDGVTNVPYPSLASHLLNIDQQINLLHADVVDINNAAGTGKTLAERIIQLQLLQNEVDDAHREGYASDTLAARFGAIDTLTQEIQNDISDLDDSKVNVSDIVNKLTVSNTNKPLSANMGKTLRDMIGGTYDSTNTVTKAITDAQAAAETNAKNYADTNKVDKVNIYNDLDYVPEQGVTDNKVLDARQGKALKDLIDGMDTAYKAADTALSGRLTAAEGAITTLNGSGEGSVLNTVNTQIAAVVANAPESFDTLKEIADWIDTHSDSAIEMQQSITDNADAIAALQDTITDENTGLAATKAIADAAAVKTEVDNSLNGLDARLDAIDGGETLTGAKTLATRVGEAESAITTLQNEPKSATEIVAELPQTGDATKDYLLGPNKDGKYFYYKWINNEWNLISGGSGEGNTSGMDLTAAAYDELQKHAENTDYYVAREDGVHHYRWVPNSNNVLEEIEICNFINTNNIKTYNATTSTTGEGDEQITYLDLYEFNYGVDNTTIDPENSTLRAHILLPKGGGSGINNNITARLVRIGNETIQTITNSKVNLYVFFSAWDQDQSYSGDYTLKYNNTVIKTGVLTSGAINATPINWVVVENPQFENDIPVINSPDTSKLYITNVDEVYTQWTYDGSNWSSISGAPEGFYSIDISDQCKRASINNNVSLSVSYGTDITPLGKTWKVNIYELNIESNAPDTLLISSTDSYNLPYTAFGALSKTLHVIIDNDKAHEITASLSAATSGYASTISIPPQAHGTHKIEMYLTAIIGGIEKTTTSIIREYIWYDINNEDTPVLIASPLNGQTIRTSQYSTIEIPYQVYKKNASTIDVYYYLNDNTKPYDHVILNDVNTGVFSYVAANDTDSKITIKVEDKSIVVNLDITESPVNVSPVTGAIIDFDPASLTNSSANRLPKWTVGANTYSLTASDNFNWSEDASGGGYKTDTDGKAFVIKAGSYVDLDYPMFAGTSSNNVLTKGAEMKIIFKTEAVRDIEAVWFTNTGTLTGKTVGIQLGAHYGWLKTDKATDTATEADTSEYDKWVSGTLYNVDAVVLYKDTIYKCITEITDDVATTNPKDASSNWLSMGKIDTEVLATNSYLYFPYSEQDKIELDININKYNTESATNFIMSYEDGVPSKAYAYEYGNTGDGLYHNNTIRIGSPDCDVYIYRLRIYDKALDTDDILQNFIADGQDINEKVKRYDRNCIYWDSTQNRYFTSPSANAHLDPIKLAEVMPDVKVLMLDTPIFTTGKKNFVQNSSLRCIHADGGNIYKSRGDADNWLFTNGFHSGQGTTSDNYGQSARNVDFLFEVDGVNYPAKNKNMKGYTPSKDYVSTVYIGNDASTWDGESWTPAREPNLIEICSDWKEDNCKVSLTETSVPNNYFNLKVNVASSENVNNALFQKRYDDFLAYNSPAQTNQIAKHRNTYAALGMNPDKIKVKNGMEFVPAVLFVRENSEDISKHTEFKDRNWHFYALGNIGDSKKTDYTRAYDPDDMNEFTLENSDNNTKNGQFQSGVYMDGNTRVVERNESGSNPMQFIWGLSDEEWNATREPTEEEIAAAAEEEGIDVRLPNGQVYVNYRHRMLYAEPFDGDHSFEFRYACCGDYRDGDLINPLKEDTDPDRVARYKADKAQEKLNTGVFYAFYDWLVMSDDATFKAEASQWIVPAAMEFFYAYTHYYTMMDNRAKNTFWHFAKTGTYVEVTRPVAALLHVYEESDDDGATWHKATGTEIVSAKRYRTQYAFDLWAYDMDTAAGIDNNGAQVFPYGKEDGDYRVEGDSLSGYAFNGAGSIFWRRIKTSFANEIRDIMTQTDENCFNAQDLIDEFDSFQNCFPEEIWRLDIERKYIRTFTGESIDKSVEAGKQNPRFLTSMMQGRKKYQRRQWIRDQGVYFNSKYRLPDILANENTLEFNATTPDVPLWVGGNSYAINNYVRVKVEPFDEEKPRYEVYRCIEANSDTSFTANKWHKSVTPSYYLQLTPYQDMYLNVQLGNGNYQNSYMTDGPATLRAKAGQTYTFDLFGSYQETRIYINGAKHLSAISNLGPMYPYKFDLRGLDHLKVLGIGVDETDYRNTKLDELGLPNFMPLLETVNIKNCHSLGKTLTLSTANNIRTVEAAGTIISGISLPDYTSIETLHIPSTVIGINLYGARFLNDFKIYNSAGENDYSTLYKLHIYDSDYSSTVDWMDIAEAMLTKQSLETEISLLKLNVASIGDIQQLEQFSSFKPSLEAAGGILELTGNLNVTGSWSQIEKDNYAGTPTSVWPNLNLNTTGTESVKRKVTFKYNNKEYSIYITVNNPVPDPYALHDIELPVKESDPIYKYNFGSVNTTTGDYIPYSGWKYPNASGPVGRAPVVGSSDITLEPFFVGVERKYTIRWFLDAERTQKIGEVDDISYGEGQDVIIPTVANIHDGNYNAEEGTYGQYETCTDILVDENGNVEYKLFTGWDKLPTNIQPDGSSNYYDIFAVWEDVHTSAAEVFANVTEHALTPEQLLVLSAMPNSLRANAPFNKYDEAYQTQIQLGHDSIQEGNVIVSDTGNALYLSGSNSFDDNAYSTDFQPFKDKAFTFVIDYTFEDTYEDENTYSVLASCYHSANNVKHGFGIFKNNTTNAVEVGFGNMYEDSANRTIVNSTLNSTMRNIVVLRHPAVKEDDTYERLYVYSSQGSSTSTASNVTVIPLQRTANTNFTSNAYLNIGQLLDPNRETAQESEDLTDRLHAKAKVHWAKYWDYDIGAGECQLLASWPHEQVTFSIASINKTSTSNTARATSTPTPSLYLNTVNTLVHGIYSSGRISTSDFNTTYNSYGWRDETLRTIYNNRIFNALPIKLQAVATKPSVSSLTIVYDAGDGQQGMNAGYRIGPMFNTRDYVYAYSAANVLDDNSSYEREDTLLSPFKWKNTNVIVAYNYSVTSNNWSETTNITSNYLNMRFPYKPISWGQVNKMRVYLVDSLSNIPNSVALSIGRNNLRSGDILITGQEAYIYVSNAEINRYGLYPENNNTKLVGIPDEQATQIDSTNAGSGGWLKATSYWTRSLVPGSTSRTSLASVQVTGTPEVNSTFSSNIERKFNFIIAL